MTPRIGIERMAADVYLADPCETPSLSNSIAHLLDSRSPKHAWSAHPRLGGNREEPEDHFDAGTLVHALLLGTGPEIAPLDFDDWRTKAAKAARAEARARGAVPVKTADYTRALAAVERLRSNLREFGFTLAGQHEACVFWIEDGVQCRAMLDCLELGADYALISDLKSSCNAHPDACSRHIDGYGYAMQQAAYTSAIEHVRPDLAGRIDFAFLFLELYEPFAVQPVRIDGTFRQLGQMRWRRALATWKRCLAENVWPSYSREAVTVAPPPWAMARELERGTVFDAPSEPPRAAPTPKGPWVPIDLSYPNEGTDDDDAIF